MSDETFTGNPDQAKEFLGRKLAEAKGEPAPDPKAEGGLDLDRVAGMQAAGYCIGSSGPPLKSLFEKNPIARDDGRGPLPFPIDYRVRHELDPMAMPDNSLGLIVDNGLRAIIRQSFSIALAEDVRLREEIDRKVKERFADPAVRSKLIDRLLDELMPKES